MRFGQYEILERIAVGGMAEIYRGRAVGDEGFEKPVAIKRILPHFASDSRFVEMLVTEARIHASLSHKNIVQIHDLGISEEGEYFIVLEYVDGRDLAALLDVLARTPSPGGRVLRLSDAVALYTMIELGEGAHFAHELRGPDGQPLGLIHRDISPSNVLVSYAGEVKLSDFGLAKRRTNHSVVGSLKGKLAYMSPEQARRTVLDRRSDIFALGTVLFEMVTGHRLRDITDDGDGWRQVASGLVPSVRPFRPDLPPAVERVLAGALAPDPRDRFADARALVAAAREALASVARSPTSEEVELQALLRSVLPPGAPRSTSPASKVIRLVSEFLPNDETVRMVMPDRRRTTLRGGTGAPPVRADNRAEARPRPRAPGLTPPAPALERRRVVSAGRWEVDPERVSFGLGGGPAQASAAGGAEARSAGRAPARMPTPAQPVPAPTTPAPPELHLPPRKWPEMISPYEREAERVADAARESPVHPGWPRERAAPRPRPRRRARRPRRSRAALFLVLILLPAAAALIHYFILPLPVLRSWGEPARLEVVSQPSGADVFLDGHRLSAVTPMYTEVQRDRRSHSVEVRKEGFQAAHLPLRFDESELLTVSVTLQPENRPSVQQMPREVSTD